MLVQLLIQLLIQLFIQLFIQLLIELLLDVLIGLLIGLLIAVLIDVLIGLFIGLLINCSGIEFFIDWSGIGLLINCSSRLANERLFRTWINYYARTFIANHFAKPAQRSHVAYMIPNDELIYYRMRESRACMNHAFPGNASFSTSVLPLPLVLP